MINIFLSCPAGATEVQIPRNCVAEFTFRIPGLPEKPFLAVDIDCRIKGPDQRSMQIPAFWKGGDVWALRFASPAVGSFTYAVDPVTLPDGSSIHVTAEGSFDVIETTQDNPLMKHGPVRMSENKAYHEHIDGTPFFQLADSWWHGMTQRLPFEDFCFLVKDRREQGFTSIQFAITNPCDVGPFDERATNEGGQPWTAEYGDLNPAYFDWIDRRFIYLVEQGLLPSMVGSWGYYMGFMGLDRIRKLWRYLYARYGAFPCMLVLCGESKLPWYGSNDWGRDGYLQTRQWTTMARELRGMNVYNRPLAVHPGPDIWNESAPYAPLEDMSLVDFFYGMGGHGAVNEWENLSFCIDNMNDYRLQFPGRMAMVGECLFEGMMGGGCGPKIQRALFWHSVLNGAKGHCYGADALWQMNSRKQPFGVSGFGKTWGNFPWEEAYQWGGSRMVALGKKILERFEWWRFTSHPEWVDPARETEKGYGHVASAAGIPGELRLIYLSRRNLPIKLRGFDPGVKYTFAYIDPLTGDDYPITVPFEPDGSGEWDFPAGPISQDWLLLIEESRA